MTNEPSDEDLMVAYQLGDEIAFAKLYERHAARAYGFIRSKLREESAAKDVLQGTFLKLHKSRAKYDRAFPFLPWLFTICRSEMLDAFKKEKSLREEIMGTPPEPVYSPPVAAPQIALGGLSLSQREALQLRFAEDLTFEQIAERLATSPGNARQMISRAVRNLRRQYGKS